MVIGLGVPLRARQWLFHRTLRRTVGDLTRFGLPAPDHRVYETHPIANSQLVYYVGHGSITPVPDVARFTRDRVEFADGRVAEPDLVILATGYLPRFEFLAPELLNVDAEGRPRLHLHTFSPAYPTLGRGRPAPARLRASSRWCTGRRSPSRRGCGCGSPHRTRRPRSGARHQSDVSVRFNRAKVKQSTRHWFEVSHVEYLRAVREDAA